MCLKTEDQSVDFTMCLKTDDQSVDQSTLPIDELPELQRKMRFYWRSSLIYNLRLKNAHVLFTY